MTTILIDASTKTVYTDTQVSWKERKHKWSLTGGLLKKGFGFCKSFKPKKISQVVTGAGCVEDIQRCHKAWYNNNRMPKFVDCIFIVVDDHPSGLAIKSYSGKWKEEVIVPGEAKHLGSGAKYCAGAYSASKCPIKAIEVSCALDVYSGGGVVKIPVLKYEDVV